MKFTLAFVALLAVAVVADPMASRYNCVTEADFAIDHEMRGDSRQAARGGFGTSLTTLELMPCYINFTGNVLDDFAIYDGIRTDGNFKRVDDPGNNDEVVPPVSDVGMPEDLIAEGFTRSGWDFKSVYLNYCPFEDSMQVGILCYGICGDADGDGNEADGSPTFENINGGTDYKNLQKSETFSLMIDAGRDYNITWELDFLPQLVVGWPGDLDSKPTYGVYNFDTNAVSSPGFGYLGEIEGQGGRFKRPGAGTHGNDGGVVDIEFEIKEFSTLPGFTFSPGITGFDFKFQVFAGSFQDDGVGEDFMPGVERGMYIEFPACAEDACGVCLGPGTDSCGLCPGDSLYNEEKSLAEDECGVCFGSGSDICGLCPDDEGYGLGLDECGLCPTNSQYGNALDACGLCNGPGFDICGLCPGDFGWNFGQDDCGLCPQSPLYDNARDECDVCFGTGRDECELCPADPGYGEQACYDCAGVPFGTLEYDDCGECGGTVKFCCEVEEYKGYLVWQLDKMLVFYNVRHTCSDVADLEDVLEESLMAMEAYDFEAKTTGEEPVRFCDFLMRIEHFQWDCVFPFNEAWNCFLDELETGHTWNGHTMWDVLSENYGDM